MDRRLKMILLTTAFFFLSGMQGNAALDISDPGHMMRDGAWILSGEEGGDFSLHEENSAYSSNVSAPEGMT
ncbi:MAG TPA: hypothetical protein PKY58_09180 [Syntrophales bacterium]|nr:hypothetical protein [Syntrophales bacterium]HPX10913.1 hypothetical protein [Syntrophales bacterium]HQN78373.1 hypothetical protein [Syntrophales bacterium]HQQ27691.1 hypothetical protein [Syntrophales bacterium]